MIILHTMPKGRKEKPIDFDDVEKYGEVNETEENMAVMLNVSLGRVQRLMKLEKSKFYKSYHRGRAEAAFMIKHELLQTALGKGEGNAGILIRLSESLKGEDNTKKRKQEITQEITEKLVEDLSDTKRTEILTVITGTQIDRNREIDDGDTKE